MDWALAIDRNREALMRIVAALFAMAGLAGDEVPGPSRGPRNATLPNPIYRAILRVLRPAESATRRLVVILARGLAVTLPPIRSHAAKSAPASAFVRNGIGTGIWIPPGAVVRPATPMAAAATSTGTGTPSVPAFPLIDPLKAFGASGLHGPARGVPRICTPGYSDPFPLPPRPVPSLDDTVNAERLCRRLQALRRALDDLPGQAKRLARWQAKQDRERRRDLGCTTGSGAGAGTSNGTSRRPIRLSPFRPGWPPGHRARPIHEVDAILRECHTLARLALERQDTS